MPWIQFHGKNIHYVKMGEHPPYLLFIHGAGGSHRIWSNQIEFFSRQCTVFALDHPGRQGSEVLPHDIPTYQQIVEALMKQINHRPILIGHSMGGAVALTLVLKNPDAIEALVLVGTGARLRVLPSLLNNLRDNFNEAVKLYASMELTTTASEDLRNFTIKEAREAGGKALLEELLSCDKFDVMNGVAKITHRSLIVCGREDKLTPVKYAEYFHRMIHNSHLEIIEGAGHMVMLEKPEEFNNILARFIHYITQPST